jgi:hypothetical protein
MNTYRQTYNAARKHYAPIFERIIREQFEALLLGNEPDMVRLQAALTSIHTNLGVKMAKRTKEQVLKRAQKMTDVSRYELVILQYLERMGLSQLAADITETTREQLRAILLQQAENNLTTSQVMTLIEARGLPRWRGELIARTETSHAANVGAMVGALDTGLKCRKEWISAQDNRTRREPRDQTDHLHMNGVQVEMDDNFQVPSKIGTTAMLHPGQPGAPANQVCNCRCSVAFIPVRGADNKPIKLADQPPLNGNVAYLYQALNNVTLLQIQQAVGALLAQ